MKDNKKKDIHLGMPFGTAMGKLRKNIMFSLVQRLNEDVCYRCNEKIETVEEFSIEHKEDWLNGKIDLFWNLNNITFSHLSCNTKAQIKRGNKGATKIISPDGYSWCATCKKHKKLESFYKDKGSRNGCDRVCKKCRKEKYNK